MTAPARRLTVVGEAGHRDEAAAMLQRPGDAAVVNRGRPRSLLVSCPDGCGETLAINLDPRSGKAWRMHERGGATTLYPSIWRDGGCGSHFIVWRDVILWCDRFEEENEEPWRDPTLEPRVLAAMDQSEPLDAERLAETLDELVWDVGRAARALVAAGRARSRKKDGQVVFTRGAGGRARPIGRPARCGEDVTSDVMRTIFLDESGYRAPLPKADVLLSPNINGRSGTPHSS